MTNLKFFKACLSNELNGSLALIKSLPSKNLDYSPHPVNRTARQITEHIIAHLADMKVINENAHCDETMTFNFTDTEDAAGKLEELWNSLIHSLNTATDEQWENELVELTIEGKPFVTLPRFQMMWFFFNDIIHHRGQLSSYVRPMGGKNPAIYGYSADTL
jgi:uncharacterized damage-inducible protein DinB